jgi:hypothetical protein
MIVANHTKKPMLLLPTLLIGLKQTSNFGAPLSLSPLETAPVDAPIYMRHDFPPFRRLIELPAKGHVRGYFRFLVDQGAMRRQFDGDFMKHTEGPISLQFEDILSERRRTGGWGSHLRKLD